MVKKGASWDWTEAIKQTCVATKWAGQQTQVRQIVDRGRPFELHVHVTHEGYGWGLWQKQEHLGHEWVSCDNCAKERKSSTL